MNMILHCTICDDNPSAVKREKEIAERAFCEMNISADISVYTDSSQFMFELGDNKQMDILILDIEMPKMSGFEIADAGIHRRHLHGRPLINPLARSASSKEKAVGAACSTVLGLIPGTEKPGKDTHIESPSFQINKRPRLS